MDHHQTNNRKGHWVLVVDDDPSILTLLEKRFSSNGFEVITAPSGSDALRAIASIEFNLIILDLVMPGTDGTEVARMVKESSLNSQVPVIYLTGLKQDNDMLMSETQGPNVIFGKPFDAEALIRKARELIMVKQY